MSFFKDLTLERVFIILSLLGSLALLYTGINRRSELNELRAYLENEKSGVPAIANELQQLSKKHSSLYKAKSGEGFLKQDGVESYIRSCSAHSTARIGQISISHNENELDRKTGLVDHVYTIKTQNSDTTLGRMSIVSFLRELEANSRQIRVTTLQLRQSRKTRIQAHEIPPDAWLFDAVCTSRVKKGA